MTNVFDTSFINTLKTTLDTNLADKKTVARKAVCNTLNIDEKYADVVTFILTKGVLDGFEIIPGRYGGIAKEGTKTKRSNGERVKLTDEFVAALRETLAELCADGTKHFRPAVATAMGLPGADTEKLISDAFKADKLPEYKMVRGRHGGIRLRDENDTDETTTATVTPVDTDAGEEQEIITPDNDEIVIVPNDEDEIEAATSEEMIEAASDEEDDSIDLSDYNLDNLDDEVKNILMRQEETIQNNNVTQL